MVQIEPSIANYQIIIKKKKKSLGYIRKYKILIRYAKGLLLQ